MEAALRDFVRQRAGNRCEYCRLPQHAIDSKLHVEHIVATQHELPDSDDPANLALACNRCNLHKGTNLVTVDPLTSEIVPLFHPRQDHWDEHFLVDGALLLGKTAAGRATIRLLQMNAPHRLELRAALIAIGDFP